MWSLMGCALVRVQPQQQTADHADKPEMARRRHVTSSRALTSPAGVGGGRQDNSAVNGVAATDSRNAAEVKMRPSNNSASREADTNLPSCSSHNEALAVQVAMTQYAWFTNTTSTLLHSAAHFTSLYAPSDLRGCRNRVCSVS